MVSVPSLPSSNVEDYRLRPRVDPETLRLTSPAPTRRGSYERLFEHPRLAQQPALQGKPGAYIYAHAGGLADMLWILEELSKHECFRVERVFGFVGGMVVRVHRNRDTWIFVDSYWLLRDKLAHLAHSVGMDKGRGASSAARTPRAGTWAARASSAPKLRVRGRTRAALHVLCADQHPPRLQPSDCEILHTAISRFQEEILEMGSRTSSLRIASTPCGSFAEST